MVDCVQSAFRSNGYPNDYLERLSKKWQALLKYAQASGIERYSPTIGQAFLVHHCQNDGYARTCVLDRAINALNDWFNSGEVLRRTRRARILTDERYGNVFSEYYGRYEASGCSESSVAQTYRSINEFVKYLNAEKVAALGDIATQHLYGLIETRFINCSKKTKNRVLRDIRYCLEYIHVQRTPLKVFQHTYPHVRVFEGSGSMPYAFTTDEVTRLLASVERSNPVGRRDYAILLIAARYGLRACDISQLRFSDFDWSAKSISFVQSKTGETLSLPLMNDVGWAVIEYIENGRPKTQSPYVFVTHNAPHDKFLASLNHIVAKYMNRAGIAAPANISPGIHAIRRALATEMLRKDVTISAAKEVLGHSSIRTTIRYQRMETKQLALCALEVPHA